MPRKVNLMLTDEEREIIPQAIEAGRDFLVGTLGKRARLQEREAATFTKLLLKGGKIPLIVLAYACFGLEVMWWKENKRITGIPELLARLEMLCGYRRTGGEPPRKSAEF